MGHSFEDRWKEELVYQEDGREYAFFCTRLQGEPRKVHVPVHEVWDQFTPDWLHGRRDEIITKLHELGDCVIVNIQERYAWPPLTPGWLKRGENTEPPT